ncbi:hypothetical protein FALBO_11568 [Fusarium albosuccineum]|uniref:Uncharacterized protein n=1 Tax=Fusarium albosuccineum TaxID=1237068 RepID=A0A8H4P723_9HYPO|nr:hypothetical protein FALBO_11568 [Fusarium albosuccineum]
MYILLCPLAIVFGIFSYYIWLRHAVSRLPKHDHSSQRSQPFKPGYLSDSSAAFFDNHPKMFIGLAIGSVFLGICVMTASAVLTSVQGGDWAIALSGAPALCSILIECLWLKSWRKSQQDAFSEWLLWMLLGAAGLMIVGATLTIWFAPVTIFIVIFFAITYRGLLLWEWGTNLRDTMEESSLLVYMMVQVTALGVNFVAFGIRLPRSGLASAYTEMVIISYGFVLLDLATLLISTFRLRCRYASAAKEARAAFITPNSTMSLAERSSQCKAQEESDGLAPRTGSSIWAHRQDSQTIHKDSFEVDLELQDTT